MGFLGAEQEIYESTNPSFLQQCKICNLSLNASSHGLMGIVSMPCVQFWQFEGIYITYCNSHTGCHKMCLSNCNLHFAECHFAQRVWVFSVWNGGLEGNCSDSSIWDQHSALIMLHRGGRTTPQYCWTWWRQLLLSDAAHVVWLRSESSAFPLGEFLTESEREVK